MNIQDVLAFIAGSEGRFFSIEFIKRTTGETRTMLCRTGVKKALKGGGRAYDPTSHGLVWVYDVQKQAYRSIPIEGITRIMKDSKWVNVTR